MHKSSSTVCDSIEIPVLKTVYFTYLCNIDIGLEDSDSHIKLTRSIPISKSLHISGGTFKNKNLRISNIDTTNPNPNRCVFMKPTPLYILNFSYSISRFGCEPTN